MPRAVSKSSKQSAPSTVVDADLFIKAVREADRANLKSPVELFKALNIPSPLFFRGTESIRLKRLVTWLLETALSDFGVTAVNFFGAELNSKSSLEPVIGSLRNLSLFSPNQAIVIHDVEGIKAQSATTLAEEIKRSPFTLVILTCASDTKAVPLADKLEPQVTTVQLKALEGAALQRWVKKELKALGANITDGAAALLANSYENDLGTLSQHLLTLSLLADQDSPITETLVRELALKSAEQTSFELVAQIANKNLLRAQKITGDLINQGLVPLQINAFLGRSFRMMLAQKAIAKEGRGATALPQDLSHPWFLRKLSPAMGRFSDQDLQHAVTVCADLDLALKSSGLPPELALSLAVTKLTQPRQRDRT